MASQTAGTARDAQTSRRLRDSCTACAQSKVKCSKEKPTCSRCARRNFSCDYGVSRRTGRHPYPRPPSASGASPRAGLAPGPWPGPGPGAQDAPSEVPGSPIEKSPVNDDTGVGSGAPAPGRPLGAGDVLSDPHTPFSSSNQSPLAGISEEMAMDIWDSTDFGGFSAAMESPMIVDASLEAAFLAPTDPAAKPTACCCLTLALETLAQQFPNPAALCQLPDATTLGGNHQIRTLDSVISENTTVMATVSKMLECPCSEDEYVAIIITLILFKVMGWYAAAAKCGCNNLPELSDQAVSACSRSSSASATSTSSLSEQVMHFPTTVGNYCVNGQEKSRMAAQLVLSELHRVSSLVDKLSVRLHGRSSSTTPSRHHNTFSDSDEVPLGTHVMSGSGTLPSPRPSNSTAHQLEQDLRQRLRLISSSTITILRHT